VPPSAAPPRRDRPKSGSGFVVGATTPGANLEGCQGCLGVRFCYTLHFTLALELHHYTIVVSCVQVRTVYTEPQLQIRCFCAYRRSLAFSRLLFACLTLSRSFPEKSVRHISILAGPCFASLEPLDHETFQPRGHIKRDRQYLWFCVRLVVQSRKKAVVDQVDIKLFNGTNSSAILFPGPFTADRDPPPHIPGAARIFLRPINTNRS
jgi:hypothetical protein